MNHYFAALQLRLFFVLCEQVTKTKLGWALTAFTTSLSYCLLDSRNCSWMICCNTNHPHVSLCILMSHHLVSETWTWSSFRFYIYDLRVFTSMGCASYRLQSTTGKTQVWSVIAKPSCYVIMSWAITELHYYNGLNLTKRYKDIYVYNYI